MAQAMDEAYKNGYQDGRTQGFYAGIEASSESKKEQSKPNKKQLVYLAAPYSHSDPKVIEERVSKINKKAAELMDEGYIVFSPISHSHPIADHVGNHQDHDFWLHQDLEFLNRVDHMMIFTLDGWDESFGIQEEIRHWKKLTGKDPEFVN